MMQHQLSSPAGKQIVPQKRRKCVIVFDIIVSVELSPSRKYVLKSLFIVTKKCPKEREVVFL